MSKLKTKRWNDPSERDEGLRVLVTRYRPRGVREADETWDVWYPHLGPSRELHAEYYGKHGAPLPWGEFKKRYLREMKEQTALIDELAALLAEGKTVTLLCSSHCVDPARCHRTLLAGLVEERRQTNRSRSRPPTASSPLR